MSVALLIEHAVRMRRVVLPSLSCLAVPYFFFFPHCLINGTIFGENVTEHKICFLYYLQLLSETFLILKGIRPSIIINRISCEVHIRRNLMDLELS